MRIEKKMFNCYENNVKSNPKHKDPKNRLNFIMQNKLKKTQQHQKSQMACKGMTDGSVPEACVGLLVHLCGAVGPTQVLNCS